MDLSAQPGEIEVNHQSGILTILWKDNHKSNYQFGLLRSACPCVQCRGGHEFMRSSPDPKVFTIPLANGPAAELNDVEVVGNYALTIHWADGHQFGIYPWEYLRELCPCLICHPK